MVLPAAPPVRSPSSPLALPILAIFCLLAWANDHSTYAIEPSALFSEPATPSLPFSASPPGAFQVLSCPKVQSPAAEAVRYLVKLSVVPELSERCTVRILGAGSVAPGVSAAIAGPFQGATLPAQGLAMVRAFGRRLVQA